MITRRTKNTSVSGVTLISVNSSPTPPAMLILGHLLFFSSKTALASVAALGTYEAQEEQLEKEEVIIESLHSVGVGVVENNGDDGDDETVSGSDQSFCHTEHDHWSSAAAHAQLVECEHNAHHCAE